MSTSFSLVDKNEEDKISEKENAQNELIEENKNKEKDDNEEAAAEEEEEEANRLTKSTSATEKPTARQLKGREKMKSSTAKGIIQVISLFLNNYIINIYPIYIR